MHPLRDSAHLFRALAAASRDPSVRGVITLAVPLIVIASTFYWIVEGWPILDCVYFSIITIATVGYGDFVPQTSLGKIFTIFYVVAGIGVFASAVSALAQAMIRGERQDQPLSRSKSAEK